MNPRIAVLVRTLIVLGTMPATALLTACGDSSTPPEDPKVEHVVISGVRLDPATFRSTGTFAIGIVPTTFDGRVILTNRVDIDGNLVSATPGSTLTLMSSASQPASTKSLAAALNIDNSGSMSGSDPSFLRRSASKNFWDAVLAAKRSNEIALTDFGAGQTSGFGSTRLLQSWGRDTTLLRQRLDSMTASGGTPLYESALETLQWIDTTRTAAGYERVMLLMTDGLPGSDARREAVAALAVARGITIHTVGLGVASDLDPRQSSTAAVLRVRELAYRTGGVYAAAASAAALDTIFRTIAQVSSTGQFLASFRISPTPPSGTVISGTVSVTSGGVVKQANWSLVAP